MLKIAVVGVAEKWSTDRLVEAVKSKVGDCLLVDLMEVRFESHKKTICYQDFDLSEFHAIIIKKIGNPYSSSHLDRLDLLNFLTQKGVKIFSLPRNIKQSLSRISNTMILQAGNIPMPDTVITEDLNEAVSTVENFREVVFKPNFSTKAQGMKVIKFSSSVEVRKELEIIKNSGHDFFYLQKLLDLPGKDLGMAFVGGQYLCTYARVKQAGQWNTTTASGGRYQAFEPTKKMIELGYQAQSLFNLDFTCVDIVESDCGLQVFEVSAFGGFRGIWEANKIDAAELYVNYIIDQLEI